MRTIAILSAVFICIQSVFALPLKIGIPAGGGIVALQGWSSIVVLLRERGIDASMEVYPTQRAAASDLRNRYIDAALLDPYWVVRYEADFVPLVESVSAGSKSASILIVVPRSSIAYRTEDLVGATFAFPSERETVGYCVPLVLLSKAGVDLGKLGKTLYTGSSIDVLKGVAFGGVDAGAVESVVAVEEPGKKLMESVRIIAESRQLPLPMIVHRRSDGGDRYLPLRNELVALATRSDGRTVLESVGRSGFLPPESGKYGELKRYLRAYGEFYGSQD